MNNYQATIHTMELTYRTSDSINREVVNKWAYETMERRLPYICGSEALPYGKGYRFILNPHRMATDTDGEPVKHFEYVPLEEMRQRLAQIGRDLGVDAAECLSRVDICLDTKAPYRETEKMSRLIASLIAVKQGFQNCYSSIDPIDLTPKATRMQNRPKKKDCTLELEHYNRSLIDQSDWNCKVENRFEFRMYGQQMRHISDLAEIPQRWASWLKDALNALDALYERLNRSLLEEYAATVHGGDKSSKFNSFIIFNQKFIYTRKQLNMLFELYAEKFGHRNPRKATENFVARHKADLTLYTANEIENEVLAMVDALDIFCKKTAI